MQKSCYAYIRVSTAKQGTSGSSLQEQRFHIQSFSDRQGFAIAEWFEERETAAKRGRTEFARMLSLLRSTSVKRVVIHKIDRSARNLRDWADLAELIDAGIEVHFAHESLDLTSRGGRLSADIQAVVAADFIRNLRDEVKKGLRGRLRQGIYPFRAPIGYLDNGRGKTKSIDPVSGPLIRYAFERYASGQVNFEQLLDELAAMGLRNRGGRRLSFNGLTTVFHNPFYYGLIKIKRTGETFVGEHEPLIQKRLFDEVHDRLAGKKRNSGLKHRYLFQRLLQCAHCRKLLHAEIQKSRYVYYRCHTRGCLGTCVSEPIIQGQVAQQLSRIMVAADEMPKIEEELDVLLSGSVSNAREVRHSLQASLLTVQAKQKRLSSLLLDERMSPEDYQYLRKELNEQELSLQHRITKVDEGRSDMKEELTGIFELIKAVSFRDSDEVDATATHLATRVISNFSVDQKTLVVSWFYPYSDMLNEEEVGCGDPHRATHRTSAQRVIEVLRKIAYGEVSSADRDPDVQSSATPQVPEDVTCLDGKTRPLN